MGSIDWDSVCGAPYLDFHWSLSFFFCGNGACDCIWCLSCRGNGRRNVILKEKVV